MDPKDTGLDALCAELLQALAHPLRLKLLKLIGRKRVCQCELAGLLEEHPVNISRHLSVLERGGLITFEKEGTRTYPLLAFSEILPILRDSETLGRRITADRVKQARRLARRTV
jgi:DNA-binding transcriptional ArsR family regulator